MKDPLLITVLSDIAYFRPVTVPRETNEALNIQVIPQYDTISLELNDRIKLRFTPNNPIITPDTYFAGTGEFLRDSTFVYIVDDDSKYIKYHALITSQLSKSVISILGNFCGCNCVSTISNNFMFTISKFCAHDWMYVLCL